jgi:hypothetical protein
MKIEISKLIAAPCHVPGSKPERVAHYRAMIRAGLAMPAASSRLICGINQYDHKFAN